jgi:hypothetical protein
VVLVTLLSCVALGSPATLDTRSDWLRGSFNGTTVDKPFNSNLSLGYANGTSSDKVNCFWRFDNSFEDYSGNSISLLDSQNVFFTEGVFGTRPAGFEGSRQPYLEYEDDPVFDPQNFTVAAWINPDTNAEDMPIIEKSIGSTEGFVFFLIIFSVLIEYLCMFKAHLKIRRDLELT